MLDLLSLANTTPITNADARELLKLRRSHAWDCLSRLVELGLLEKRGHAYRASPYAKALVQALFLTFRSIVSGKPPQVENPAWVSVIQIATDGLESLYSRGRIDQSEYAAKSRLLKDLEAELSVKRQ